MNKLTLPFLFVLSGCTSTTQPVESIVIINDDTSMRCAATCVEKDVAVTAGHCVGEKVSKISFIREDGCVAPQIRLPIKGEEVIIKGSQGDRTTKVFDPKWLTWTLLEGRGIHSESGGGVYGRDGALLAVIVETHDDYTYAHRVVQ